MLRFDHYLRDEPMKDAPPDFKEMVATMDRLLRETSAGEVPTPRLMEALQSNDGRLTLGEEGNTYGHGARFRADAQSVLRRATIDEGLAAAGRGELHPRAQLARAPAGHRERAARQSRARGGRRAHLPRVWHGDAGLHLYPLHPAA